MFAKLTSLVGGGVTLPFDLADSPPAAAWGHWTLHRGTLKADGSPCSIFRIAAMSKEDPKLRAARNGVKRLRTLRHPNVLAFKDTVETEERGEQVVYLVTEAVAPLTPTLQDLGLTGPQREQYLAMGLHQVVSAVSFINNDCKLLHGNVCAAAVVATDALDWKLQAFDLVTEAAWPAGLGAEVPLAAASWAVGAQYKPGEVAKGDWAAVREGPSWAVDAWGLGCLIQEVYSGAQLARTEDLRATDRIPQAVLPFYQRLLSSAGPRRLNPAKLLESGVLNSKLGDVMAFLENLAIKDAAERDAFFKRLPALLPAIPVPVAQRKLLPLLASALEFGGAPPSALGTLLAIGEGMSEEGRAAAVLPILSKLFSSNDRGIRRSLLENIASFGAALPEALVEDQIYPHVQTGFGDANPYLRELTLKSMVVLAPKLSQKTLNHGLLKHLAKLQVDEEPAIRANTTVLLGTLAPQLPEGTCKKVLLNAFTRALKDPFPPARAAGLRAVLATAKHHSPEDVAARVVPMVGPLCVDAVQEVRSSALQCLDHFAGVLAAHSKEMDRRAAAAGEGGGAGAAGGAGGGLLTGFGWAVSSLVSSSAAAAAVASPVKASPAPAAAGNGAPAVPPPPRAAPAPAAPAPAAQQGWGDDEDFDAGGAKPAAASSAGGGGGEGWGDDDDDLLEDMMDAAAAEREARERLARARIGGPKPAGTRRPAGSAARPSGGLKLGAKKLEKDAAAEFADW